VFELGRGSYRDWYAEASNKAMMEEKEDMMSWLGCANWQKDSGFAVNTSEMSGRTTVGQA
jgi:hypothetical protein